MKKKEISNRKNKRFPTRAHAIFAIAICLCMLFTACKDEPDDTPPPPENKPPTASAGVNGGTLVDGKYEFDFTLPNNRSITFKGSGADTDDSIKSYAWTWGRKRCLGAQKVPGGAKGA